MHTSHPSTHTSFYLASLIGPLIPAYPLPIASLLRRLVMEDPALTLSQDVAAQLESTSLEPAATDAHDPGVLSHTDDDNDDKEIEINDKEKDKGTTQFPGTAISDPHPELIDADADLTRDCDPNAEYLDLIHLKIRSIEDLGLERFPKLQALCLRQNQIESMAAVSRLPVDLEELDLYDNRINHISSAVNNLTRLQNLDLSFNNIKNIKNIDRLVELENLYFVQNRISEIKNLGTLRKLKNLELGGNRIAVILEEMLKLPSLTQLWLGKNKISKLQNLDNLINLRVLSIQSNRINKIEGLDKLVNLEELYLSHNGIYKIENLENNTNLTVLDVTANRISHLENLLHLVKLTDFWCSNNQVSSFEEISSHLGKLPELDTVYFEGNPVETSNRTAYRRKLRLCLGESLAKIDATYLRA